MADDDILSRYYGNQQPDPGADQVYDTSDVRARIHPDNVVSRPMRSVADMLRTFARGPEDVPTNGKLVPFLANAGAGGLDTAANWLDQRPRVGPDTLAPLGLATLGTAPMGALASGAARRVRAYHGSDRGFPSFREHEYGGNFADLDVPHEGVWFTDQPNRADLFAHSAERLNKGDPNSTGRAIYPADLDFKNPYIHSAGAYADEGISSLPPISELRAKGHDGVIVPRSEWMSIGEDGTGRGTHDIRLISHGNDYAAIAPGTVTSPLSGKTMFADNPRSSLPGILVNGLEEQAAKGSDVDRLRSHNINAGREALYDYEVPHPWDAQPAMASAMDHAFGAASGSPAQDAAAALRLARGDAAAAAQRLSDNERALNVLKFWQEGGLNTRAFHDPTPVTAVLARP